MIRTRAVASTLASGALSVYGDGAEGYTDYPSRRQLTDGTAGKYRLMEQDKIGPSLR